MAILEEETYKKFGYYPHDLKLQSHKRIVVVCDNCGIKREIEKGKYRGLCSSCSKIGIRNPAWDGGGIEQVCAVCGNTFLIKRSQIKSGRGKYCSRKCQGIAYSKDRIGDKTGAWKGGKVKRICLGCGEEFFIRRSEIDYGRGKYCSRKCQGLARSKIYVGRKSPNWKGGPLKRECLECGKVFFTEKNQVESGWGKFCSLSCATRARMRNVKPHMTLPERIFESVCNAFILPFRFVGDGSLWLGNANPDFIHNTRKLCVEIFGDYWHSPLLNRKIRYTSTLEGRRKQLKVEGYKLIVLWESDVKREDAEQFILYTLKKHNIFPSTT